MFYALNETGERVSVAVIGSQFLVNGTIKRAFNLMHLKPVWHPNDKKLIFKIAEKLYTFTIEDESEACEILNSSFVQVDLTGCNCVDNASL